MRLKWSGLSRQKTRLLKLDSGDGVGATRSLANGGNAQHRPSEWARVTLMSRQDPIAHSGRAPALVRHVRSEKVAKLLDGQANLSNDGTQCSLGNFLVIRHGQASVWCVLLPKNHVTPSLSVEYVADLLPGP